ncbi:serine palmitoyltransferase component [Physocladia obscura]|uniref:serine C-palmitoyltransferase n=1 Tax=Physocladia obscura TaxID=109957 RepID=A0AAD5T7G3_9FUNG|nr:serine palmitoyltransferase component [Physocladia obscura]
MGKGSRAHFKANQPPLSSADLLTAAVVDAPFGMYKSDTDSSSAQAKSADTTKYLETAAAEPSSVPTGGFVFHGNNHGEHCIEKTPLHVLITTYLSYFILIITGHLRDFIGFRTNPAAYAHLRNKNGYAPLNSGFDTFYHRRLYTRIRDVFNRPITNVPGRTITLLERQSKDYNKSFQLKGTTREVLNLSSYNYLGFAQSEGPCADAVEAVIKKYGIQGGTSRMDNGTLDLHLEAESLVARFMGKEAAMIVSMGFATNSTTIPSLAGKGSLVISDELNHASIVFGARVSGASIKVFKHNDMKDLEQVLREAISQGQPRTHRPWKKILLIVEGLYSMEGSICNLPGIIALKNKYKFYLYLDEAHSVGAMGPNGRGICDYYGIDPSNVDILMGTFTKSFGAAGGYLAASKRVIDYIRFNSHSNVYAESITPPILQQIITSTKIIMCEEHGNDGRRRIQQLAQNSKYFCSELKRMGFIVYGVDSPVVPLLLCHPAKIPAFSREMLKRGIAVVVVGYPGTPIITSRVRFCISAAHTMEDIKWALEQISEVGDMLLLKVSEENGERVKKEKKKLQ